MPRLDNRQQHEQHIFIVGERAGARLVAAVMRMMTVMLIGGGGVPAWTAANNINKSNWAKWTSCALGDRQSVPEQFVPSTVGSY